MNHNGESYKQCSLLEQRTVSKVTTIARSVVFRPTHPHIRFCHSFVAPVDDTPRPQLFQVCRVATVVMETTQLFLRQFNDS